MMKIKLVPEVRHEVLGVVEMPITVEIGIDHPDEIENCEAFAEVLFEEILLEHERECSQSKNTEEAAAFDELLDNLYPHVLEAIEGLAQMDEADLVEHWVRVPPKSVLSES